MKNLLEVVIKFYSIPETSSEASCLYQSDIQTTLAPYMFPLFVEFCVIASCMVTAIWEGTGLGADYLDEG